MLTGKTHTGLSSLICAHLWLNSYSTLIPHPPTQAFRRTRLALAFKATLLGAERGSGLLALLRHHVELTQAFDQTLEGQLAVARLRARVGGDHHHAGRKMRQAHGRFGLVQILSARTAGTHGVETHLVFEYSAIETIWRRSAGNVGHAASITQDGTSAQYGLSP
jgi:hypothetical protein